jgi:hypothetical protein
MTTPQEQAEQATTTALATVSAELAELEGWTIESDEHNELAAEMLRDVKARHKGLEAKRKGITVPMNTALKGVNDLFRKPLALLKSAEHVLKGKIADYLEEQERANAAALAAAAAADTPEQATEALATVESAAAPAGVNVRYRYQAIVRSADLVPDQFRMPDEEKIQAHTDESVKAHGFPTPIPGVEFVKTPIVTSRAVKS